MPTSPYLREIAAELPAGAELLHCGADGVATLVRQGQIQRLDPTRRAGDRADFLRFIDQGHFTRYFVGAADTSDANPANATYKLGVVAAHRGFTPHAHGAEHFVFSTGYAACGLYDAQYDRVTTLRLLPGTMLHIPALMPHTFQNRAGSPLLLLVANTGMGVDHEDYAITAAQAEQRAQALAAGPPHPDSRPGPAHTHAAAGSHDPGQRHGVDPGHDDHDQPMAAVAGAAPLDYAALAPVLRRLEAELPAIAAHNRLSLRERLAARLRALAEHLEVR